VHRHPCTCPFVFLVGSKLGSFINIFWTLCQIFPPSELQATRYILSKFQANKHFFLALNAIGTFYALLIIIVCPFFNLDSFIYSMVQDISIDYSYSPIQFHSWKLWKLWPPKVNWVLKFTLHHFTCNSLTITLFEEWYTPLEIHRRALSY
jgi:hypothetical protein